MEENNFEKSYKRLEQILETLNANQVSLEDSLKLFEEANSLILTCEKKLNNAEKKIEILIKNRDGSIAQNEEGSIKEDFNPSSQQKSLSS